MVRTHTDIHLVGHRALTRLFDVVRRPNPWRECPVNKITMNTTCPSGAAGQFGNENSTKMRLDAFVRIGARTALDTVADGRRSDSDEVSLTRLLYLCRTRAPGSARLHTAVPTPARQRLRRTHGAATLMALPTTCRGTAPRAVDIRDCYNGPPPPGLTDAERQLTPLRGMYLLRHTARPSTVHYR